MSKVLAIVYWIIFALLSSFILALILPGPEYWWPRNGLSALAGFLYGAFILNDQLFEEK